MCRGGRGGEGQRGLGKGPSNAAFCGVNRNPLSCVQTNPRTQTVCDLTMFKCKRWREVGSPGPAPLRGVLARDVLCRPSPCQPRPERQGPLLALVAEVSISGAHVAPGLAGSRDSGDLVRSDTPLPVSVSAPRLTSGAAPHDPGREDRA